MSAADEVVGVDHCAFTVEDMDRTLDFYVGLLGFQLCSRTNIHADRDGLAAWCGVSPDSEAVQEGGDYELATLELDGARIEFLQWSKPRTAPFHLDNTVAGTVHFALRVRNLAEIAARLEEAGVELLLPVGYAPRPFCVFKDSSGIAVELVQG